MSQRGREGTRVSRALTSATADNSVSGAVDLFEVEGHQFILQIQSDSERDAAIWASKGHGV